MPLEASVPLSCPLEIPPAPTPIALTVTANATHLAFSLTGPNEITHQWSMGHSASQNDALVEGTIKGLESITPSRLTKYQKSRRAHEAAIAAAAAQAQGIALLRWELTPAPISIMTNCEELIEAGLYLRTLRSVDVEEGAAEGLAYQLGRFDVSWILLPHDSEELIALQRWATQSCVPGQAVFSDGPTRQDWWRVADD